MPLHQHAKGELGSLASATSELIQKLGVCQASARPQPEDRPEPTTRMPALTQHHR